MSNVYIGIDPGKSGAVAVINNNQNILLLEDWPGNEIAAASIIRDLIKAYPDHHSGTYEYSIKAAIERSQSMPGQGVRSMFVFGTNYGIWQGVLAAFQIPFIIPTPQAWQKGIISKAKDKKPALAAASRMFPLAELYGPRGGGKDGRADALLIADFCRRLNSRQPDKAKPERVER